MNLQKILTITLFILVLLVQPSAGETEWIDHGEKTLYWGETTNITDYMIKAVDFTPDWYIDADNDYVILGIYKNGTYVDGATLAANHTRINNTAILCKGNVKIVAKNIITGYNIPSPYTVIRVYIHKEEPTLPSISPEKWIDSTLKLSKLMLKDIYIGDWINVDIRVENLKEIDLDIRINDSIPSGFELVPEPDKRLLWNLSLSGKGSSGQCQYSIKAAKPGIFTFPPVMVVVEYQGSTFSKMSDTFSVVVHGPAINLTKTARTMENESIAVTLTVRNTGDRATFVRVTDEIPENAELISGDLNFEMVAQPGKIYSCDYVINAGSETELPLATATFKDDKKRIHEVISGLVIPTIPDASDPLSVQTPQQSSTVHSSVSSPNATSNATQNTGDRLPPDDDQVHGTPGKTTLFPDSSIKILMLLPAAIVAFVLSYLVACKLFKICDD